MRKKTDQHLAKPLTGLEWAAVTDVGKVRPENQDAFAADPDLGLFIVSDGMGGQQAGDLAAKAVTKVLPLIVKNRLEKLKAVNAKAIRSMLRKSLLELNTQLHKASHDHTGLAGMGATVVMAFVHEGRVYIANLGDSRAYLLRAGRVRQLSEDHSVAGLLLRKGEISTQEAAFHPGQAQLTRYIGMSYNLSPHIRTLTIKRGDRFLLCTDGLNHGVSDNVIAQVLRDESDPKQACQRLLDTANAAGGRDNITTLVIDLGQK